MEPHEDTEPAGPKGQCPCDDPSQSFQVYSDGHGFCFAGGCPHPFWSPERLASAGYTDIDEDGGSVRSPQRAPRNRQRMSEKLTEVLDASAIRALPKWKIRQETCQHWDYRTMVSHQGRALHVAVYKDEHGAIVDAKIRDTGTPDEPAKDFFWASGHAPKGALYGAQFLGNGGRMVVIAMGEKDALSCSQLWDNKFPVVSPQNGEAAGPKSIAPWLERLCKYDKVVIAQDMDEAGIKAGQAIARLFPPGKAFIAKFPRKDLTDTVLQDGATVAISAIHNAAAFRPDGIVDADDIDDQLLNPTEWGLSLPYEFLTKWTYGLQGGAIWIVGAGTGIGKSDLGAEFIAHLIKPEEDGGEYVPVAVFNYEAASLATLKTVLGKLVSKRLNIPDPEDGSENLYWSKEDMLAARTYRREKCAKLFINDHKGAVDWPSVKERIRYLKHVAGIKVAAIDPMAALVAQEDDDRKALDKLLAEAKSLAEELDVTLVFFSHLARPREGKSHEEGGRVELRHFRGSGAIVMWASFVLGMERNQQAEDEEERAQALIRVLKDRFTGDSTGRTHLLVYNALNGRYEEVVSALDALQGEGPVKPPPLTEGVEE